MATNPEHRPTIAWQQVAEATALHAAGTPWREICARTGLTEWQWKRVRQLYNATLQKVDPGSSNHHDPA